MWTLALYDWRTWRFLGDIAYQSASLDVGLCRAGTLDLSVPAGLWDWPEAEATTCVVAQRDGLPVGGWIVTATHRQGPTVTVAGVGPFGYWDRRQVRTTKSYTATDQLSIAKDLLDSFGSADARVQVVTRGAPVPRDRTYNGWERKQVSEAITQLAEVNGGFEFVEQLVLDGGVPQMRVEFVYPRVGSDTGIVWDQDAGTIRVGSWLRDGGKFARLIDALGSGDGAARSIQTASVGQGQYPAWEDVVTHQDVTVAATLAAHAQGELARRDTVAVTGQVELLAVDRWPPGSWQVGDRVTVVARSGGWQVDTTVRVAGWGARLDGAQETVTVDLVDVAGLGRSAVPLVRRAVQDRRDVAARLRALERI